MESSKAELKILATIGVIVLIPVEIVINGFVLVKLWEWFISSHFGVKEISIPIAIGICLIVGQIKTAKGKVAESKDNKIFESICIAIITPLFILVLGYIVKLLI